MEADSVPVKQCLPAVNPCCALWKEKCSKLEGGRKHLRQAVQILTEQFDKIKAEKDALQEAYEDEKVRARSEKVVYEKELAARVALENEISALKSEINSSRVRGGADVEDKKKEVKLLHESVSKAEKEIVQLKALIEKEKKRADSVKKNAEAQKKSASEAQRLVKAEQAKAEEERKLAYGEGKKAEDHRLQSQGLKKEVTELKSKLESETLKFAEASKKLEAEKHKVAKERKRVDSEMAKVEELRKLAEANGKNFMEEKSRADNLSQQLEDARKENEKLQDIHNFKSFRNLGSRKESSHQEDKTREVKHFQDCISEGEKQISHLKVCIEKEKEKADQMEKNAEEERKNATEAWKCVKTEKDKVDEEKRNADIERKNAERYKIQLEALKKEANETKVQLTSKILQLEKAIKELKKGKHRKSKEAMKSFDNINKKRMTEREHANIGSVEVEEQRELVEVNKKMALKEKSRADQLSFQLEESRLKIDELQKQIQELVSRKEVAASTTSSRRDAKYGTRNLKCLEKQLKLEKIRLKYAKQVRKSEMNCNNILKNELSLIKMDSLQLSRRLGALDKWFASHAECREDLEEAANLRRSKLERKLCDLEPFPSCAETQGEPPKSSCTDMAASDPTRRILYGTAPFFPVSEGNFISGIHPKLRSLDGGSSQKLLQSSAMNSSSASFSDDRLTGSQERGAFVSSTSEKQIEENNGKTIWCTSGEVTKTQCTENLAVVAENSVKSPNSIGTYKDVNRAGKFSTVPNAVKSVETLYSEGMKLHFQMEENLSALHGMLKRKIDKPVEASKHVEESLLGSLHAKRERSHKKRKIARSDEKMYLEHLCSKDELENTQTRNDVPDEANACNLVSSPAIDLLGIPQDCIKGSSDSFGSHHGVTEDIEEIENGDFMKLLDLDNSADEEHYRRAMEMPLSPTLPEIDVSGFEIFDMDKFEAVNKLCGGLSNEEKVPFHGLDVIGVEVSSNKLKCNASATPCDEVQHENEGLVDSSDVLRNASGNCNTMVTKGTSGRQTKDSEVIKMSHTPGYSDEGIKFSSVSSESKHGLTCDYVPPYCVVLSNSISTRSVSRIFSATKTCMIQFLLETERECVVQEILHALKMEDKILPEEKACVLFTLLLLNFSWLASVKSGCFMDKNFLGSLDSFARQINAVLSDAGPRSLFEEIYCWDELVGVIDDFLLNGQLMVPTDASSETLSGSDSNMKIFLDGIFINLSSKPASVGLLVTGSIILASVCTAIDHIDFICEASYDLLRFRKYDNHTLLTILHVFAYLGGKQFLYMKEYSLTMTVLRSIVVLLEREHSSDSAASCLSPSHGITNKFQPCGQCLFDSVAVDFVLSLLCEKLHTCAPSVIMHQHLMELADLPNTHVLYHKDNAEQRSSDDQVFSLDMNGNASCVLKNSIMPSTHLKSVGNAILSDLTDVLSLVELVACYMSWEWTCGKVIPMLLEILEGPILDDFAVAVFLLLGQVGRFGIAAHGYENKEVESLKSKLSGFLWRNTAFRSSLPVQIAIVTSLLGLLHLSFKEVVQSDPKLPEVARQSVHIDSIKKWFSMLSKEQQTLSCSLLGSR